ncbi:hypothetical protein [uncultured Algibacter sp.]|uniref:hypothetical protein n=1 Tax=uncultured Algibacter sp. TaxID=298659 RepID=UPI002611831E|nr:hypothetical protein [uncultured Algibacter sp.]
MTKRRNNSKRSRFSILFPILTIIGIGVITAIVSNYEPNWSYNWNGIRKEIKDSLQIAELRGITSGIGGMGASTKNEVDRRRWIMKTATESELLKLTEYPNGIVKGIAYEGLLRKKGFSNKTELTLKAIRDTTYQIDYQSGCLGWNMGIGEYLVQNVLLIDDEIPPPERLPDFGLTEMDKEKILTEFRKLQVKKE